MSKVQSAARSWILKMSSRLHRLEGCMTSSAGSARTQAGVARYRPGDQQRDCRDHEDNEADLRPQPPGCDGAVDGQGDGRDAERQGVQAPAEVRPGESRERGEYPEREEDHQD